MGLSISGIFGKKGKFTPTTGNTAALTKNVKRAADRFESELIDRPIEERESTKIARQQQALDIQDQLEKGEQASQGRFASLAGKTLERGSGAGFAERQARLEAQGQAGREQEARSLGTRLGAETLAGDLAAQEGTRDQALFSLTDIAAKPLQAEQDRVDKLNLINAAQARAAQAKRSARFGALGGGVGAVVGGIFGGPQGAQTGATAGSSVTGAFA